MADLSLQMMPPKTQEEVKSKSHFQSGNQSEIIGQALHDTIQLVEVVIL